MFKKYKQKKAEEKAERLATQESQRIERETRESIELANKIDTAKKQGYFIYQIFNDGILLDSSIRSIKSRYYADNYDSVGYYRWYININNKQYGPYYFNVNKECTEMITIF